MGASVKQSAQLRKRRRARSAAQPLSEINVTPFVDVMLVLLIIFMVTAPLLAVGVPIDLPKSEAKQLKGDKEPITVSVKPDGKVFLQEREIALDEIVPKLKAIAKNGYQERIYVRGDAKANYGAIMKLMGKLSGAGFQRLALVTDSEG